MGDGDSPSSICHLPSPLIAPAISAPPLAETPAPCPPPAPATKTTWARPCWPSRRGRDSENVSPPLFDLAVHGYGHEAKTPFRPVHGQAGCGPNENDGRNAPAPNSSASRAGCPDFPERRIPWGRDPESFLASPSHKHPRGARFHPHPEWHRAETRRVGRGYRQ